MGYSENEDGHSSNQNVDYVTVKLGVYLCFINIVIYGAYMGYRPNQNDYSHLWTGRSLRVMS